MISGGADQQMDKEKDEEKSQVILFWQLSTVFNVQLMSSFTPQFRLDYIFAYLRTFTVKKCLDL